jgi:hypothetical protein
MYTKDKTQRITLRLSERQFEFVRQNADVMGVSPSEFLRIVVNTTMSLSDGLSEAMKKRANDKVHQVTIEEVAAGRENDKADIDDKL